MYEHGLRPGLKVRHGKLSEHITFETGRLMVVTGIPGHGKSEFVDEITTDLSVLHNWKTGYFSPENWPVQLHISKLMAKITGNWIQNLRPDELDMCATFLDEHFFWVMPEDEEPTLETILTKAEYLIKKYGIRCFVIDPWNTIEFQLNGMTETQYINKALSTLGTFCKRMDILIILVAHPTKMQKSEGVYEVPNLYSINGSSHFYNKADYGVTVYRVQSTDDVQIHIQKVKFRHLGHTGMVEFRNNHNNGRYQELTGGALVNWDNINRLTNENDQVYLGGSQPDAF
jgi:twinkle protein